MTDNFHIFQTFVRNAATNLETNVYNELFVSATKGMQHTRRIVHKVSRKLEHSYTVQGNGKNMITFGSNSPYANVEENVRKHYHFQPGVDLWSKEIPVAMARGFQKSFS